MASRWLKAFFVVIGVLVIQLTLTAFSTNSPPTFVVAVFTAAALHIAFKVLMAVQSCRSIGQDKRDRVLEILLVTPTPISQLLRGHIFGVNHTLKSFRSILYTINLFFLAIILFWPSGLNLEGEPQILFTVLFLGGMGVLAADVWSMGWLGLFFGAQKCKPSQAIFAIVSRLVIGPWILALLFVFLAKVDGGGFLVNTTMLSIWLFLAIISSLLFGLNARDQLRGRWFHRLVAEPEYLQSSKQSQLPRVLSCRICSRSQPGRWDFSSSPNPPTVCCLPR